MDTIINGTAATISPAVQVTSGPSGQPANFQSQLGTGVSQPITITFARPVSSFSVTIVGQSYNPHVAAAYDSYGRLVDSVTTNTTNPDNGGGGGTSGVTLRGSDIAKVILTPPPADYVAYMADIAVTPSVSAPPPVYAPPPEPRHPPVSYQAPVVAPPVSPPVNVPPPVPSVVHTPPIATPGIIRATKVSQMYTITPNTFTNDILYLIGEVQSTFFQSYTLTNITTNADLSVTVRVPKYLRCNTSTSLVKPKSQIVITVELNQEEATNQFIATKQSMTSDELEWNILPTNYSGPIYIPTAMATPTNTVEQPAPVAKINFGPPNLIIAPNPAPPRTMAPPRSM